MRSCLCFLAKIRGCYSLFSSVNKHKKGRKRFNYFVLFPCFVKSNCSRPTAIFFNLVWNRRNPLEKDFFLCFFNWSKTCPGHSHKTESDLAAPFETNFLELPRVGLSIGSCHRMILLLLNEWMFFRSNSHVFSLNLEETEWRCSCRDSCIQQLLSGFKLLFPCLAMTFCRLIYLYINVPLFCSRVARFME